MVLVIVVISRGDCWAGTLVPPLLIGGAGLGLLVSQLNNYILVSSRRSGSARRCPEPHDGPRPNARSHHSQGSANPAAAHCSSPRRSRRGDTRRGHRSVEHSERHCCTDRPGRRPIVDRHQPLDAHDQHDEQPDVTVRGYGARES